MNLPEVISQYLGDWLDSQRAFGFVILDGDGRIESWGGRLDKIGIGPLKKGIAAADQLIFMEGLLPTHKASLHLPMVQHDEKHTLDVHLFRTHTGYGLLLMDARQQAEQMADFQQRANDLALTRQIRSLAPLSPLDDLFYACDMAALRLDTEGKFLLIGRAPDWLAKFCPDVTEKPCILNPENVFSFLDNFLHEAYQFWETDRVGCIKSGMWIEVNDAGREHLFEASAINTGGIKILLIADEHSYISEKQNLIQKGRELALGHCSLEKSRIQLQVAHDDLEIRVGERTRELERTNRRLAEELNQRQQLENERTEILLQLQQSQKMEAIGTLAGGIAHDFNNILSAVIGFTELSLFEAPGGSQLQTNLQHVFAAAQRAKELIRQILTFSRQTNPEIQPVQVVMIIREAAKLLRASLPASIEIEQDLKSRAFVMADPTQLHQVVMNLCTNAGHAMHSDGGVLRIQLQDRKIRQAEVSIYPDLLPGNYIELSISDTGRGMTKETMGRIYEPFYTTKSKGQGTGMGLSVVHGIVKNCKGDITVSSQPGKGATFRILLPTMEPMKTPEIATAATIPKGSERILFVDDEPMQTDLAAKILAPLGYQVEAFTDSASALERFTQAPDDFDLVITDMYMPKMTGKTLAAKIHKLRPQMPIILSSGYANGRPDDSSKGDHIKGDLMKPFGMKEMVQTIRNVLDGRHDQKEHGGDDID